MFVTTKSVDNVITMGVMSGTCCCGIGFWTAICYSFSMLFGVPSNSMNKKVELAKNNALKDMIKKAQEIGATGIMDVSYQVTNLNVFVYGTAYKARPVSSTKEK